MDITYVGKSDGDYFELYHLLSDGDRPVLEVLVDPENVIWVAGLNNLSIPQPTNGKAHRHALAEGLEPVICLKSVAQYIVPRGVTMMARVYFPAPAKAESENG